MKSGNYLITGVAGTGKSALAQELNNRGYAAYDTDKGFSYYTDKLTGDRVSPPPNPTPQWYSFHQRVFDEKVLMNLIKKHSAEPLFICSITANQSKFYAQFDKIFLLTSPDDVVIHRLGTRTNSYFGRHPTDLARVIDGHKQFDEELRSAGAIPIDSTRPIETVADELLADIA
jgi:gluconate kinase